MGRIGVYGTRAGTPDPCRTRRFGAVILVGLGWVLGCEFEDDDEFVHVIPAGLGTLVVDNEATEDIDVFIDGIRQAETAREDATAFYDLSPGQYRVVLDEVDGDRSFREDIDILSDRLSVLEVFEDLTSPNTYNVELSFD